jgi:hypothetical protein
MADRRQDSVVDRAACIICSRLPVRSIHDDTRGCGQSCPLATTSTAVLGLFGFQFLLLLPVFLL